MAILREISYVLLRATTTCNKAQSATYSSTMFASDTDGDGVGDHSDACPEDPNDHEDTDGDGACDSDAFPK